MFKITIVTPSFNSAGTILKTVESINRQLYRDFEHIIIDAGSGDDTIKLIKENSNYGFKILSEPDDGIYDAMNKGIRMAQGEIVAILNSDDYFIDENVLADVQKLFSKGADVVYAGIIYSKNTGKLTTRWLPTEFTVGSYRKGWHTPHPAFFAKKSLYDKKGLFDTNYKIAADFDLMLRFMEDPSTVSVRLMRPVVIMRDDGASSRFLNILKGMSEIFYAFRKNKIKVNWFRYVAFRYLPKFIRKFS